MGNSPFFFSMSGCCYGYFAPPLTTLNRKNVYSSITGKFYYQRHLVLLRKCCWIKCILILQGIDEELSLAAESFLEGEDGCVLNMPKREVRLNMSSLVFILSWILIHWRPLGDKVYLSENGGFKPRNRRNWCENSWVVSKCFILTTKRRKPALVSK